MFARLADGGAQRLRAIEGQATLLGRTMHAIAYDAIHDEIVVPQQFGQAILTYAGDAAGEAPPKRVIIGSKTQLSRPDRVGIDAVNNEILVPEDDKVLVFPREGQGNVAPIRIVGGAEAGVMGTEAVVVDAKRDLMIVAGNYRQGERASNSLMIFDRTASGTPNRSALLPGSRTTVTSRSSRKEDGFSWRCRAPSRIPTDMSASGTSTTTARCLPGSVSAAPNGSLRMPRGVVLDAKNQSVIVSDKKLNAILTFRIPEIFTATAAQRR